MTTSRPTTAGIVAAIKRQIRFMAERGSTAAGYVAFYTALGDTDEQRIRDIHAADAAQLVKLIDEAQTATGPVTVATMIAAGGGSPTVYGIFRARLRVRRGERWWDLNAPTTQRVATLAVRGSQVAPTPDEVVAALREHATPDAPAFDFRGGFLLDEPVAAVMPS